MTTEKKENEGYTISRRSLLKGMIASGAAFATIGALSKVAKADEFSGLFPAKDLSNEKLIWMYETMLKSRLTEMWVAEKITSGEVTKLGISPNGHTSVGHEAVAVGFAAAADKNDWFYRYMRHTCNNIARGMDQGKMCATIISRVGGYGRSTHSQAASVAHKQARHCGMIGFEPLYAAGTAYGQKITNARNGTKNVTIQFNGDGAWNAMDALTSLNYAALYKLPVIFVVENNGFQIRARTDQTMAIKHVAERGKGFGIPGVTVDGMDPISVYNVATEAIIRARAGEGPTIVECEVYRYFDHSGFNFYDPAKGVGAYGLDYRSDKELAHWVSRDPIPALRRTLIAWKVLDEKGADAIVAKAKADTDKAWEWALAQPKYKGEDILKYQYADGPVTTELPRQLADCPLC